MLYKDILMREGNDINNQIPAKRELKELRLLAYTMRKSEPAYKAANVLDLIVTFAVAILAALFIQGFLLEFTRVEGPSMEPTLYTGERMFVEKLSYGWSEPERGDVIICHYPGRTDTCVKRVIGLPGDEVAILGGMVFINGSILDESGWWEGFIFSDMEPRIIPADSLFVMGDNRNLSSDSRDVGNIPFANIVGRVHGIIWPTSRLAAF